MLLRFDDEPRMLHWVKHESHHQRPGELIDPMDVTMALPAGVVEVLDPDPEREVLAGVSLLLVIEGKRSVARAGAIRGLPGRLAAIRWYTRHGPPYPDLSEDDFASNLAYPAS